MISNIVFLIRRRMCIRKLKRRWASDRLLRRAALKKGWMGIIDVFHYERSYKEVQSEAQSKLDSSI